MSAMPQPEQATPITDEVLEMSFQAIYNQLNLTLRRIGGDDLDRRALEMCIGTVEQLHIDFATRLNENADSYNALCDTLDELQSRLNELSPLQSEIARIRQDAEDRIEAAQNAVALERLELENKAISFQGDIDSMADQIVTAALAHKALDLTHKNYVRANPTSMHAERKKLEKDVSSLRAERKDLNKRLQALQSKLNVADKEIAESRRKTVRANQERDRLDALYEHLKKRVDLHDGREDVRHYTFVTPEGHEVTFYLYNYHFGLMTARKVFGDQVIELADFHYQIRTAAMYAVDVVPSVWGRPVYNANDMIELARNSELDEELSRRIQARMLLDFPKIHQRIQDANNAPIDELLLTAKTLSVLKKAGCESVLDIAAVLPKDRLNITGVGEKMAAEIEPAINSWCIRWSKEHGDVEPHLSNVLASSKSRKAHW